MSKQRVLTIGLDGDEESLEQRFMEAGERNAFDVVPTLCELLGAPPPEGLSGASLLS